MSLITARRKYLSRTEQCLPGVSDLFISKTKGKKWVSQNTISFWIRSVISQACGSASEEECRLVTVRAHKGRFITVQEELVSEHFLSLLSSKCHLQAHGHRFHQPVVVVKEGV